MVVSVNPGLHNLFEAELKGMAFSRIGKVDADKEIRIDHDGWGYIGDWKSAYDNALEKLVLAQ